MNNYIVPDLCIIFGFVVVVAVSGSLKKKLWLDCGIVVH